MAMLIPFWHQAFLKQRFSWKTFRSPFQSIFLGFHENNMFISSCIKYQNIRDFQIKTEDKYNKSVEMPLQKLAVYSRFPIYTNSIFTSHLDNPKRKIILEDNYIYYGIFVMTQIFCVFVISSIALQKPQVVFCHFIKNYKLSLLCSIVQRFLGICFLKCKQVCDICLCYRNSAT